MKLNVVMPGLLAALLCAGCGTRKEPPPLSPNIISGVVDRMTELMVHDVTNPPLAARFFAYACLAGYEVTAENDSSISSLQGLLKGYPGIRRPDSINGYAYTLSAVLAMLETAGNMQPSGKQLKAYETQLIDSCRLEGYPEDLLQASRAYAVYVSKKILAYAKADGYNRLSNLPRYAPSRQPGAWYPTPPAYISAVEPEFRHVRPFTLDSAQQFKPAPPVPYSADKQSLFYRAYLLNNYHEDGSDSVHREIAGFWDCNPFAVEDEGHLSVGLKKISPGAHWMGITGIACAQSRQSFAGTMRVTTLVAIGLTDSFIACWDEKYRSNRVRPETAIRDLIDTRWKPLLQTPPFPEYLSGHSCISATAATVLTDYFGEHFSFRDTVEMKYGLVPRTFTSFQDAAVEAGISRFYGGIHFMDAIDNGRAQGLAVGNWVWQKLNKKK